MYKMFSLTLKRCAFYLQVRQFASFICNKNNVDKSGFNILINYTYLNYSSLINPKYKTLYRPQYDNVRMQSQTSILRPIMNVPLIWRPPLLNFFYKLQFTMEVREKVDKTFYFNEFETGALQAVKVVSDALASQNYEALNDLVEDNVLQKVNKWVDDLTDSERRLIAIDKILSYAPCNMNVIYKETDNHILEITEIGYYLSTPLPVQNSLYTYETHKILVFNYTFQRNYKHGEGGPWMITVANHFSLP